MADRNRNTKRKLKILYFTAIKEFMEFMLYDTPRLGEPIMLSLIVSAYARAV